MKIFDSEDLNKLKEYTINSIIAVIVYLFLGWVIKIDRYNKWVDDIVFIVTLWFFMYYDWRKLIKYIVSLINNK